MKISIIGAGNIGGAIAHGLTKGSFFKGADITISDVNEKNLQNIINLNSGIHCTVSNRECVKDADLVVLAVKPWMVDSIAAEIRDLLDYNNQIVLCIAAGVPLAKLRELFSHSEEQVRPLM
jgi:pyrroline-5-carboxylate reductase